MGPTAMHQRGQAPLRTQAGRAQVRRWGAAISPPIVSPPRTFARCTTC